MAAKKAVKKNYEAPLPPSANVVDTYKTYLQKAMSTITAKDFAEGASIPTDQVEKDILILENKIAQYKKFGFPFEKEEKQVEILKSYKSAVKGKNWPTAKQAMNAAANMAVEELKHVGCPHEQWTTFTTATNVKMRICTACGKTWHAPLDPKASPQGILASYYDKASIANLKANNEDLKANNEEPTDLMFRVGKCEVDQKFIMRMGMLSNCNASVAKKAEFGSYPAGKFVLSCSKCKDTLPLTASMLIAKENALASKVEQFCVAHKHGAKAPDRDGRLFRVED